MLPREILRQIRRIQFRARRAVEDLLGGEYHSVFKGAGLTFEEVREYQPGDDVRTIDWNVTARMGHPYVKRFVEERELTVMLLVDWSASHIFGTQARSKRDVVAELAALLAFSAVSNNDRVGLVGCTDRVERFLPPRKGVRHALRIIRDLLFEQPQSRRTSLATGLDFLNRTLRRRAVVFVLGDFLDEGFDRSFKRAGRRHDLVAIRIQDPAELELPNVGLARFQDSETGQSMLVDTSDDAVREHYRQEAKRKSEHLRLLARAAEVDLVEVRTDQSHMKALLGFFRLRERRRRGE